MSRRLLWMAPRPNAKEMSTNRATEIVITIIIFDTTLEQQKFAKHLPVLCMKLKVLFFCFLYLSNQGFKTDFENGFQQMMKYMRDMQVRYAVCTMVSLYLHFTYIHTYFKRLEKTPIGTVCCNTHWDQKWGLGVVFLPNYVSNHYDFCFFSILF